MTFDILQKTLGFFKLKMGQKYEIFPTYYSGDAVFGSKASHTYTHIIP